MAARNDDADFVISRDFDAPRELVFRAWTETEHLSRWWGPHGFTNPVCEMDARPGGKYRFVMCGPASHLGDFPMSGVVKEVVPPERLVYTVDHSENPEEWHDLIDPKRDKSTGRPAWPAVHTVTFEDLGGTTRLTVRVRFELPAIRDAFLKLGMSEGWSQSLEKLGSLVATETSDREIVMIRTFRAPRTLVFKAFTDAEHLKHWWGPRGFTTTTRGMDVRPGGIWRLVMHGPDGRDYHNRIVYLEVVEPERLVFKHEPDDECEPVGHQTTVTFAEDGDRTRVEFRMLFPSAKAREHVVKICGAIEGGKQTFDRLGEHLAAIGQ
jgi:uncharacterized protein YndB with AHSA1/START domain